MRQHILNLFCVIALLYGFVAQANAQAFDRAVSVIIIPEQDQSDGLQSGAIEVLISKFAESLNLIVAGKEIFELVDNEVIRLCFETPGCIQQKASQLMISRILYGTISKMQVPLIKGRKILKGKKQVVLSINLHLYNALTEAIEKSWKLDRRSEEELYDSDLPSIAEEVIVLIKTNPNNWDRTIPPELAQLSEDLPKDQPEIKPEKPKDKSQPDQTPDQTIEEHVPPLVPNVNQEILPQKFDYTFWGSVGLVGLGAGLLATGMFFGIESDDAYADYEKTNIQLIAKAYKEESESAASKANVMFATGSMILISGATVFILDYFGILDTKKPSQAVIVPQDGKIALHLSF